MIKYKTWINKHYILQSKMNVKGLNHNNCTLICKGIQETVIDETFMKFIKYDNRKLVRNPVFHYINVSYVFLIWLEGVKCEIVDYYF